MSLSASNARPSSVVSRTAIRTLSVRRERLPRHRDEVAGADAARSATSGGASRPARPTMPIGFFSPAGVISHAAIVHPGRHLHRGAVLVLRDDHDHQPLVAGDAVLVHAAGAAAERDLLHRDVGRRRFGADGRRRRLGLLDVGAVEVLRLFELRHACRRVRARGCGARPRSGRSACSACSRRQRRRATADSNAQDGKPSRARRRAAPVRGGCGLPASCPLPCWPASRCSERWPAPSWSAGIRSSTLSIRPNSWASVADMKLSRSVSFSIARASGRCAWPGAR